MSIKNTDVVKAIADKFPTFNGHTAKDAFNLLTANGYDQMAQLDLTMNVKLALRLTEKVTTDEEHE